MTTPYAKLFMQVNGGSLQDGGITVDLEDEIQLAPESTVGWDRPATVYQITAYPTGWSAPASWTLNGATNNYEYYADGANGVQPPPITMPAAASNVWGKWKFRLLVNGGGGIKTDWLCGAKVLSPGLGLNGVAKSEGAEFGGSARSWAGELQEDLEQIDAALSSSAGLLSGLAIFAITISAAGTATEATGLDLVNASFIGVYLVNPNASTAIGVQVKLSKSGSDVTITSYRDTAAIETNDVSTYNVVLVNTLPL